MSYQSQLRGLYVITDDTLTPDATLYSQTEEALKGGATIIQLRDKHSDNEQVAKKALKLQELCRRYDALFVLNDRVDLAIELGCDGLHIGRSDHQNFSEIRREFAGVIGVSCYGDIELAKRFEQEGADYVAFGSFFASSTKPEADIVPLDILSKAKSRLDISICAIGGINSKNVDRVMKHKPHLISLVSDIWSSKNIKSQANFYVKQF